MNTIKTQIYSVIAIVLLASVQFTVLAQTASEEVIVGDAVDIEWSPDNSLIAVAVGNDVLVFNIYLQQVAILEGHLSSVTSVGWSPDSTKLASTSISPSSSVKVWTRNIANNTFTNLYTLISDYDNQYRAVWSPNGSLLASSGGTINYSLQSEVAATHIWNIQTGELEHVLPEYLNPTNMLAWSPDSTKLIEAGDDFPCLDCGGLGNIVSVTDIASGERLQTISMIETALGFAWTNYNNIAISAFDVKVYDVNSKQVISSFDLNGDIFEWQFGQSLFISAISERGVIRFIDSHTGSIITTIETGSSIVDISWSLDQQSLVVATTDGYLRTWNTSTLTTSSGTPTITNIPSQTPVHTITPVIEPTVLNKISYTSNVHSRDQVFTFDLASGSSASFPVNIIGERSLVWSPDGTKVAFGSNRIQSNRYYVYVANADGSNVIQVSQGTIYNGSKISWSPDGNWLLFGSGDLWATSPDGLRLGGEVSIIASNFSDIDPEWSINNEIVFSSDRDGNYEIYKINVDGTGLVNLTNDPANDRSPTWSPDGNSIAFISDREQIESYSDIYTMDRVGTPASISRITTLQNVYDVDWSPTGSQLLFTSSILFVSQLFVIDTTGNNLLQLTFDADSKFFPSWSPGNFVVGTVNSTPTPVPTNTPTPTPSFPIAVQGQQNTISPDFEIYDLSWHPNGELLAVATSEGIKILDSNLQFVAQNTDFPNNLTTIQWNKTGDKLAVGTFWRDGKVYIFDYNIVNNSLLLETTILGPHESYDVRIVEWSPDNSKLAVVGLIWEFGDEGVLTIYDTTTWTAISNTLVLTHPIERMIWSPNSTQVAISWQPDEPYIVIYDVATLTKQLQIGSSLGMGVLQWITDDTIVYDPERFVSKANALNGELISVTTANTISFGSYSAWSTVANLLAVVSSTYGLQVWNIESNSQLLLEVIDYLPISIDWSSLNKIAVAGTNRIEIYDASSLANDLGTSTLTPFPTLSP